MFILLILMGAPALVHAESGPYIDPKMADVLIVIDNSSSMGEAQASLAAEMNFLVEALERYGVYDLHIGVITTDMGTGELGTCGPGDGGALQSAPRGSCTGPGDSYIWLNEYGRNYQGTLAETLACIVPVGTTGCDFPQPLAAIEAALDGSVLANGGFLREDAVLAILVYTDADDCSASDPAIFDPAQDLGPLSTFRCFQQGVTCDQEIDDTARDYTNCTPRTDSPYLADPARLVEFVKTLKYDPTKIVFGVLAGPSTPVTVVHDEQGNPALQPSCASTEEAIAGEPTPRLNWVGQQFANRWLPEALCSQEPYYDALIDFAARIERAALGVGQPGGDAGYMPGDAGGPWGVVDAGGGGGNGIYGCGCRAAPSAGQAAGFLAMLLIVLLGRRRRSTAPRP